MVSVGLPSTPRAPKLTGCRRVARCSERGVRLAQISKLTRAFQWEYSYERRKLAQLLGQLGVFLTLGDAKLCAPAGCERDDSRTRSRTARAAGDRHLVW